MQALIALRWEGDRENKLLSRYMCPETARQEWTTAFGDADYDLAPPALAVLESQVGVDSVSTEFDPDAPARRTLFRDSLTRILVGRAARFLQGFAEPQQQQFISLPQLTAAVKKTAAYLFPLGQFF